MSQEPSGSQQKRRQHKVERASLSEVKHFLCYFCGDFFPNLLDYQKHILNHQLYAYSYQIWHGRHNEKNRKKRQIEKSEQVTPSVSPQPTSAGDKEADQKEETVPIAPKKRENSGSLSPKTVKRRKTTSREDKDEQQISPPEPKKLILLNVGNRPRSQLTESAPRACDICSYRCNKFSSIIAHQIEVHQADFDRITMFLYVGDYMQVKKVSPPGVGCPKCKVKFINACQYYLHLLSKHVGDVAQQLAGKFEDVDNQDTEVILNRPDKPQITYTYNLTL